MKLKYCAGQEEKAQAKKSQPVRVGISIYGGLASIEYHSETRMNARFSSVQFSEYRQKYRKFVKCCSCGDFDTA